MLLPIVGCSLKPDPITPAEHVRRAQDDYQKIISNNVPIDRPLSLSDVVARALKYNYDSELSRQQISQQERQFDIALAQMLPRLALNGGYNQRSNDPAAQSINVRTRQVSLDHAFSEEPKHYTAGPEFTWTVLDVGLGYLQAKQQGFQSYVSVERRRKIIGDIVKRVQDSYWKALIAGSMLPRLQPLLIRAEKVLASAQEATRRQLSPDMPMLEFQREMMGVVGQLRHIESDLRNARAQLSTLINVPNGSAMQLSEKSWDLDVPQTDLNPRRLEEMGLALRPELREEAYQEQIDRQDIYKEIIKMMPGVGFLANFNYDTNKYLYNHTWASIGVQASFNLTNLIRGPRALAAAEQAVEVSKTRRLALSVAVLSQINLAFQQYTHAVTDLKTAREVLAIERRINRSSANALAASSISEAEKVRRELALAIAELSYFQSVTQTRFALVSLYISCGIDLVPPTVEIDDLEALSRAINPSITPWANGLPPEITLPAPAGPSGT